MFLHVSNVNTRLVLAKNYMYVSVFKAFVPMQFGSAFHSPNSPAAVQLQHSEQLPNAVLQGLRDALYSAIKEIHSLKDEN